MQPLPVNRKMINGEVITVHIQMYSDCELIIHNFVYLVNRKKNDF